MYLKNRNLDNYAGLKYYYQRCCNDVGPNYENLLHVRHVPEDWDGDALHGPVLCWGEWTRLGLVRLAAVRLLAFASEKQMDGQG